MKDGVALKGGVLGIVDVIERSLCEVVECSLRTANASPRYYVRTFTTRTDHAVS